MAAYSKTLDYKSCQTIMCLTKDMARHLLPSVPASVTATGECSTAVATCKAVLSNCRGTPAHTGFERQPLQMICVQFVFPALNRGRIADSRQHSIIWAVIGPNVLLIRILMPPGSRRGELPASSRCHR